MLTNRRIQALVDPTRGQSGASPGIVAGRIVTFIFVRELGDDVIVVNSQFQSCRDSGDGESFSHHHGHGVTTLVHLAYVR